MSHFKNLATKVLIVLCKLFLPQRYFDKIFVSKFIHANDLKYLTLKERMWCFFYGFLPYEYFCYDLKKNDHRNYVPIRNNFQKRSLNGIYNSILANKILFEKHIKSVINGIEKLHVVESIGYIEKGNLQSLNNTISQGNYSSLLDNSKGIAHIFKPLSGDGGIGIHLLRKENGHFLINNTESDRNEVDNFLKGLDDYLIQEKFEQSGFSNEIYPYSVNTMRIGTMIDPVTRKPFIAYAVHRFGSKQSGNVDNIDQGGIAAVINMDNGRLSEGRVFSEGKGFIKYEHHPDTKKPILDQQIPEWKNLCERLLKMAGRMPYLKYAGWDVILSGDELHILEGNVSPHLGLIQMFKPMKEYDNAWKFYKYYNYV